MGSSSRSTSERFPRYQMVVGVYRDVNAAMTELLLDIGERQAVLEQRAGVGVAQAVNADIPQSCLSEDVQPDPVIHIRAEQPRPPVTDEDLLQHLTPPFVKRSFLPFH